MKATTDFIQNNFKIAAVLKQSFNGAVELVTDSTNAVYVRKTIPFTALPYHALMQIKSRHLPQIYYCTEDDGKTYVIEEYISGNNLQDELEQQKNFTESEVSGIAMQICDALILLHNNGILHRDIKPGNIIVQNENVWLIDFGAAKIITDEKERDTRILGTPGYAPPEQYGFTATDARSDIYALGKTMQILLGANYNGRLQKVIAACIQFDPEKRVATAEELKKLLLQKQGYTKKQIAAAALAAILAVGGIYYGLNNKQQAIMPPLSTKQENKLKTAPQTEPAAADGAIQAEPKVKTEPEEKTVPVKLPELIISNLNFNVNNNPLYQTEIEKGRLAGLVLLQLPQGKLPTFTVHNNIGQEIQNPQLTIKFTNILVTGDNLTASSWGGRTIDWQIAKNSNGYADSVTIKLNGTIPQNDYFEFVLAGAVSNYYQSGSPAAAAVKLTGYNIQEINQNIAIEIN